MKPSFPKKSTKVHHTQTAYYLSTHEEQEITEIQKVTQRKSFNAKAIQITPEEKDLSISEFDEEDEFDLELKNIDLKNLNKSQTDNISEIISRLLLKKV